MKIHTKTTRNARRLCAATASLGLFCAAALAGCLDVGADGGSSSGPIEAVPEMSTRSGASNYYVVTRPDLRRCIFPLCGGVFVKSVNQAETTCYDGLVAEECYVADIDWAALSLDDAALAELSDAADTGQAIVRGTMQTLVSQHGETGVLVAAEGWLGRARTLPVGGFYHVVDSGIVCVTWPCPSIQQMTLNVGAPQMLAGVDLGASGADAQAVSEAQAALAQGGVLVAGAHHTITGPAGEGLVLTASEFYTRVGGIGGVGEACGQSMCAMGEFCCNPSCGICAPPGGGCIELACAPCGHGVCETGGALDAGCDQCVGKLCDQDPFCCETAWDTLCVDQAAELCGSCHAPDPEDCEHDECEPGDPLDPGCSDCASLVCAVDDYCCSTAWDSLCVEEATLFCAACD